MISNFRLTCCLFLLLLCLPLLVKAQDDLQVVVQKFIEEQIQDKNQEIIVELKTPSLSKKKITCSDPQVFLPQGAKLRGRTVVGINCSDEKKPSYATIDIKINRIVLVPTHRLDDHYQIRREDLIEKKVDVSNFQYELLTDYSQIVGKSTKRPMMSGLPIKIGDLQSNDAVTPGEIVNVLYVGQGFKVTTQGKVINAGDLGQNVQVRIVSGQVVNGIVKAQKIVEISL